MGTKLQHVINPLAATLNHTFAVNQPSDRESFRNIALKEHLEKSIIDQIQCSMDRMLEPHNVESIRKMMLIHEEIFKQQVRELHRLYGVQRKLMDELKEMKQNRFRSLMTDLDTNYYHLSSQHEPISTKLPAYGVRDHTTPRECSGGCLGESFRMPKGFDLERPAKEDTSTGISAIEDHLAGPSSSVYSNNARMRINALDEDCDLELTLSIGCSSSKKTSEVHQHHHGLQLGGFQTCCNKFRDLQSSASINR